MGQLLSLSRDEFNVHLGNLTEAFVQQADAKYGGGTSKEAIPDWLVEAGEQKLLYDPSKKSGNEDEEDIPTTGSFRGSVDMDKEKEMYKKKKERRLSSGSKKKTDPGKEEEKKKKKEEGHSEAGKAESGEAAKQAKKEGDPTRQESSGTREKTAEQEGSADRAADEKEKKEKDKKKDKKNAAKRKMSLAGGAAVVAAALASKAARGEAAEEDEESSEEAASKDSAPAAEGEKKSEKKEKKKKKSKSAAEGEGDDGGSTGTDQESEVGEIRDLVRGTLKNKYGSIAQAFRRIDGNNSDSVDFEVRQDEVLRDVYVQTRTLLCIRIANCLHFFSCLRPLHAIVRAASSECMWLVGHVPN